MPRAKRTPIDYPQQFGGIFRPRETVEDEIALLAENSQGEQAAPEAEPVPPALRPELVAAPGPSTVRTNERTNERLIERSDERSRVRHSFDIWRDQLLSLTEIQTERFIQTGRKPKLGELVQEALDAYIAKESKRTNVRTNERP